MTVLRCTAKLLKRLKQPAKPLEPTPQANPLGFPSHASFATWRRAAMSTVKVRDRHPGIGR